MPHALSLSQLSYAFHTEDATAREPSVSLHILVSLHGCSYNVLRLMVLYDISELVFCDIYSAFAI